MANILPKAQIQDAGSLGTPNMSIHPLDSSQMWDDLSDTFMGVANEQIATEYEAKGIEQQMSEGSATNVVDNPAFQWTTAGKAFKSGQQQAYGAQKTEQLTTGMAKIASANQYDPEGFAKASESMYSKFIEDTPINLRPTLTNAFNQAKNSNLASITNSKVKRDRAHQVAVVGQAAGSSIQGYLTGISEDQYTEEEKAQKQLQIGQFLSKGLANGTIKPADFWGHIRDLRVGSAAAAHTSQMRRMTADQQRAYMTAFEKQKIKPGKVPVFGPTSNGVAWNDLSPTDKALVMSQRTAEEKTLIEAEMQKVYQESKDQEQGEYKSAEDMIAKVQRDIEQGKPVDASKAKLAVDTMNRIDPSASTSKVKKVETYILAQHKINKLVTSQNNYNQLTKSAQELITVIKKKGPDLASDEEKLLLELLQKKIQILDDKEPSTPIEPGATVLKPAIGQKQVTQVEQTTAQAAAQSNLGRQQSYLPKEDMRNLADKFYAPVSEDEGEPGAPAWIAAGQEFADYVPATARKFDTQVMSKEYPEMALYVGMVNLSKQNALAEDTVLLYDKGRIKSSEGMTDIKIDIKRKLIAIYPMLEHHPKQLEGYGNTVLQVYKGLNTSNEEGLAPDRVNEGISKIFGLQDDAAKYEINGHKVLPFLYGITAEQHSGMWNNLKMAGVNRQNNGTAVIQTDKGPVAVTDAFKQNLELVSIGNGQYAALAKLPGARVPVTNNLTGDRIIISFREKDKMFSLTDLTSLDGQEPDQIIGGEGQDTLIGQQADDTLAPEPRMSIYERLKQVDLETAKRKSDIALKKQQAGEAHKKAIGDIDAVEDQLSNAKATEYSVSEFEHAFLNNRLDTGKLEELQFGLQGWLVGTPLEHALDDAGTVDELGSKTLVSKEGGKLTLVFAEKMKGALSDADRDFLKSLTINIGDPVDSNLRTLAGLKAGNEKVVELGAKLAELKEQHGDNFNAIVADLNAFKKQQDQVPIQARAKEIMKEYKHRREIYTELEQAYPNGANGQDVRDPDTGIMYEWDGKYWRVKE